MSLYILKENYISREGNVYFARREPYQENELPEACRTNSKYCSAIQNYEVQVKVEDVAQSPEENRVLNSSPNKDELKAAVQKITVIEDKINVNTASHEDLVKLKSVGPRVAEKIINERTKKVFADIKDLDKRAPLLFAAKWESLKDVIEF